MSKVDPNESASLERFSFYVVFGRGGISVLRRGGRTFGGLWMQGKPDRYSVKNIFEGLFTEEIKLAEKDIFEIFFKSADSEARKKFDSTDSVDQGAIGEQSGGRFFE